jgi:hypothetical protein
VVSRGDWHKKKYAEDPDFRAKKIAYARAYHESHRKELLERRRLRRASDPAYRERERARSRMRYRKNMLEAHYGMSVEQYDAMVEYQGGLCAICNTKPDKALYVDHCHLTGRVRSLLCSSCNSMLGFARDDPDVLEAGGGYLRAFRNEPAVSRQGKTSATSDPVVPANAGTQ